MRNIMSNKQHLLPRLLAAGAASLGVLAVTGCGAALSSLTGGGSSPIATQGVKMNGSVMGGQQPVSGSAINLYAANTTGYGIAAYPLLTTPVTTDANGNFSITGDYTCPSASSPVYITATGGSPDAGAHTNTGIAIMAGLGACGSLSSSTFITMNELTTVATAYALANFMSSPTQLSTSASNVTGLTNAFAGINKLVNVGTGQMPGSTLPAGATEPVAELNTLADILASCINGATGNTSCNSLFTNATPVGGTAPTETITAILDIARNPGHNAAALALLAAPTSPFQPTLSTAPTDFTVAVKYARTGAFSTPSAAALNTSGDLWVTNSGSNTVTVLNATSSAPTTYTGPLSGPSGIAFDQNGNAWVTSKTSSQLSVFNPAGAGTNSGIPAASMNAPTAIAVDGMNNLWITEGNGNVAKVTLNGASASQVSQVNSGTAGINAPVAVAVNPK